MIQTSDKWVALLRGVNVGGGNKVPMAALRAVCEGLGWQDVASYIASGNLVFTAPGTSADLAAQLRREMARQMGVEVPVMVLPAAVMAQALASCPITPQKGNQLHAFFLFDAPQVDWALYKQRRKPSEELIVQGQIAWLHTPEGFGTSKLADKMGQVLGGADFTARNLNTVAKLAAMVG